MNITKGGEESKPGQLLHEGFGLERRNVNVNGKRSIVKEPSSLRLIGTKTSVVNIT